MNKQTFEAVLSEKVNHVFTDVQFHQAVVDRNDQLAERLDLFKDDSDDWDGNFAEYFAQALDAEGLLKDTVVKDGVHTLSDDIDADRIAEAMELVSTKVAEMPKAARNVMLSSTDIIQRQIRDNLAVQ